MPYLMCSHAGSRVSLMTAMVLLLTVHGRADDTWPGFRGTGTSLSLAKNLPATWDLRGGGSGNWRVRLPGYGQSSPVIWKDRIFVTAVSGAEKESLHVVALSLSDGKILWQRDFPATQRVKDSDTVSRAAPTPVVDAERVYAVFESGDVFALTHDGEPVWQRSFVKDYGEIKGPHGYASSPVLVEKLLILQVAHGGPSYVLALDSASGENRWKVDHPSQTGWSSPAVYRHEGVTGVVVSTSGSVRGLDTQSGRELWVVNDVRSNSTTTPTIAGDLVIIGAGGEREGGPRRGRSPGSTGESSAPNPSSTPAKEEAKPSSAGEGGAPPSAPSRSAENGSLAIRLGGSGDVTKTHVVWRAPKVTTGYASPLVLDGRAYFVNRVGGVQCVDVSTGEILWQHRLPGQAWASPVGVDGNVVFFCKDGDVATLRGGAAVEEVGESQVTATDVVYGVAAVNGSWVVRTGRGLVRVSASSAE